MTRALETLVEVTQISPITQWEEALEGNPGREIVVCGQFFDTEQELIRINHVASKQGWAGTIVSLGAGDDGTLVVPMDDTSTPWAPEIAQAI